MGMGSPPLGQQRHSPFGSRLPSRTKSFPLLDDEGRCMWITLLKGEEDEAFELLKM